jgi:hypothetical protein
MATPISHIALADNVFNTYFEGKSRRKFFIGLLLPDIRYIQAVTREQIHFSHVHIQSLVAEDSFIAGSKFHSLIEHVRDDFMRAHSVYYSFPKTDITVHAMHFLEDAILYDFVPHWHEFVTLFTDILSEELRWKVSKDEVVRWHAAIQQYIRQKPDDRIRREYLEWLGCSRQEALEINETLAEMYANEEIVRMIRTFYQKFKYLVMGA